MDIKHLPSDPARTAASAPVPPVHDEDRPAPKSDADAAARDDRVEISDHGRSLAGELGVIGADGVPVGTLPADQLTTIRRAIQSRVHDSPDIIASVARRIAESGDV
jgi:hypothetical protein